MKAEDTAENVWSVATILAGVVTAAASGGSMGDLPHASTIGALGQVGGAVGTVALLLVAVRNLRREKAEMQTRLDALIARNQEIHDRLTAFVAGGPGALAASPAPVQATIAAAPSIYPAPAQSTPTTATANRKDLP